MCKYDCNRRERVNIIIRARKGRRMPKNPVMVGEDKASCWRIRIKHVALRHLYKVGYGRKGIETSGKANEHQIRRSLDGLFPLN